MADTWQWYHVILTMYAGWLHGDARGFRTRHHREHVEGDYRNPPSPGTYEVRERQSREELRHDPAVVNGPWRERLGCALLEKLRAQTAILICISVSRRHVHIVTKMPFVHRKTWIANAKRHAWFELRDHGWQTKLWGKRGKHLPIRTREHQLRAYHYVMKHRRREGAWVWSIQEERAAKEG